MESRRTTFYFDGFNFYNGLRDAAQFDLDWKKHYWIDFVALCSQFIDPFSHIEKVKYFTAAPLNMEKQKRWAALMQVNQKINPGIFKIIYGKYYKKPVDCPLCNGTFQRPEEKRTDVNISVQLIADCVLDLTDSIVLVSADSDLVPALQFIIKHYPHIKLKVFFPPKRNSKDIAQTVGNKNTRYFENSKSKFQKSILPDIVQINGKDFFIPQKWKK